MDRRPLAVVTGCSPQGIGIEIAKGLGTSGYHVICTSRRLAESEQLVSKLRSEGSSVELYPEVLEVTSPSSVSAFADWIRRHHGPELHAVILNAAMAFKGDTFGSEEARKTLAVNLHGTNSVARDLIPFLREGAKTSQKGSTLVVVASQAGKLSQVSPKLQEAFSSPAATFESIAKLCEDFIAGIADGTFRERGYPRSMYGVSKLAEIALAKVYERELAGDGVAVSAVCPGWCSTPMSSFGGPRSASKGAETPVWLCSRAGDARSRTGGFWLDQKQISW